MEDTDRKEHAALRRPPASADRLGLCTRLAAAALAFPLLAVVVVGGVLGLRSPPTDPSGRWLQGLCLDRPAWYPAGSPERHPTFQHPGVPLPYAPLLPPEPAALLPGRAGRTGADSGES